MVSGEGQSAGSGRGRGSAAFAVRALEVGLVGAAGSRIPRSQKVPPSRVSVLGPHFQDAGSDLPSGQFPRFILTVHDVLPGALSPQQPLQLSRPPGGLLGGVEDDLVTAPVYLLGAALTLKTAALLGSTGCVLRGRAGSAAPARNTPPHDARAGLHHPVYVLFCL
ncbi:hypothetical protein NDU88_007534 [Pleurodeles waltl]|uniref:Uncharacterized protein n=1 Tax=Pleurodeles waltl TaxID=8319 RepID=A0AAV7MGD2_PLEWA|nr:hypothetical protein NDU88_007534 [Pleurodeles waltl]